MTRKIGRNERCPCGSGKKYKQCCGDAAGASQTAADSPNGAVERSLSWLDRYHRKAFAAALQAKVDAAISAFFDDAGEALEAVESFDELLLDQLHINLAEWLLAEGEIHVKGVSRRIVDLLLGPEGPQLSPAQRAWLEQLAVRPLRLYDVTDVVPGESLTLCDALDTDQLPRRVVEHAGSLAVRVGTQIGARVMAVGEEYQFSGAMYVFTKSGGRATLETIRETATATTPTSSRHEADDALKIGLQIIEGWLAQFLLPAAMPEIVDASSGEPFLFVTDRYEVSDWPALTAALADQRDVHGDRSSGWDWLVEGRDGQTRSLARIDAEPDPRRVLLQYNTTGMAQRGRTWFESLAGEAANFVSRDTVDPLNLISSKAAAGDAHEKDADALTGIDAEAIAGAIEGTIHRHYSNWADEPVPALNGQTPREAIGTAAGLERVKGLLRSYQEGEARQAALQGRSEISYRFLWDALGLTP